MKCVVRGVAVDLGLAEVSFKWSKEGCKAILSAPNTETPGRSELWSLGPQREYTEEWGIQAKRQALTALGEIYLYVLTPSPEM